MREKKEKYQVHSFYNHSKRVKGYVILNQHNEDIECKVKGESLKLIFGLLETKKAKDLEFNLESNYTFSSEDKAISFILERRELDHINGIESFTIGRGFYISTDGTIEIYPY